MQGWGSLKSFLWWAPWLTGASSCVFPSWVSSGLTFRNGCSLMADRWQVFLFPPWVPSGLTGVKSGCNCWWLWHPLFTDMAGNILFLSRLSVLSASYIYIYIYCPFRAAYGGSKARSLIGAVAAGLCHSHNNVGSEPSLRPTPQLRATPDP